jgi:hypothetical protein
MKKKKTDAQLRAEKRTPHDRAGAVRVKLCFVEEGLGRLGDEQDQKDNSNVSELLYGACEILRSLIGEMETLENMLPVKYEPVKA